jgi:crossover junction endodeoxyribonuclease RuvC
MRVLGIDPGTSRMGWGVVGCEAGTLSCEDYGLINLGAVEDFPGKIKLITYRIRELIERYDPVCVALEEPFYAKNPRVLLRMGQAGGAVMAAAVLSEKEVFAYSVLEVKQAVVGYGQAEKKQVQEMVKILLKMDSAPKPADSADALAAAICHHNIVR